MSKGQCSTLKAGWTSELEEQLVKARPAHDDLLDVVTMGLEVLKPPANTKWLMGMESANSEFTSSIRFGGRR